MQRPGLDDLLDTIQPGDALVVTALDRLAALSSRIGRFGMEDRILDTAIPLETMYSFDSSEITFKLATAPDIFSAPTEMNALRYSARPRIPTMRVPL